MDAGKIAGIVAGSVSVVVIGGLLVVKRRYLISLFSTSPTRTPLTEEEKAEGYFYTENGDLAKTLTEYEEEGGGKRRKTQRKKKGRK